MRLKSFDNLLIALMSFIAVICLYMLYGIKYFSQNRSEELSIARITDQVNTVKRKKDFYQSWMDADVGEGLAQNDEIYTHGQSSAKIHFNNGPEVQLYENSLLRIKSHTVSLEKGNLTAKLTPDAKSLDVLMNGKKYSFESSNASIQIEQGKTENKFLITDGDAKMKLGEKAETLRPNQVLIQNKESGEVKIREIPFVLNSPAPGMVSWFGEKKTIHFNWSTRTGYSSPVTFLLSQDSSFKKIILSQTLEGNEFSTSLAESGTFFWKIVSTETDGVSSPLRSFVLRKERPLTVQLDKDILYKGPKKDVTASLHWPKGEASRYELKIEGNDSTTIELAENFYEFKASRPGETTFTVRVKDEHRPDALWSSPVKLSVLEARSIEITSALPETLEKINYTGKDMAQLISWNGPSAGMTYTLRLKHGGEEKIFTSETPSLPLTLSSTGEYSWSVQGETESGILTNQIAGKILLKAPVKVAQAPAEGAVIELEKPDQTVSFKWDSSGDKNEVYEFELAGDPAFQKTLLTKESTSNALATTVGQTGRYYWRVKIKKGEKTEYSSPVSVEIRPTPPLSRPEIDPSIKIKMKVIEEKTSSFNLLDLFFAKAYADEAVAVAEWDVPANNRAKTYIVEIYEDKNLTTLIAKIESATPHIVWKKAKSGVFYWRMSYEDFWGRKTEFSKLSVLETSLDEVPEPEKLPPPPIELNSPKHRENILENEDDDIEFNWEAIDDVKSYQFMMARDLDFEQILFSKKLKGTKVVIHCNDLTEKEGEFYWKVTAENGSSSKRRMVKTTCQKRAKEPENDTPPPSATVPETAQSEEEARTVKWMKISLAPHRLAYSNKAAGYSVDVSGNVLNSWAISYQAPVSISKFSLFSAEASMARGKVFNQFTFTDMDLSLRLHHVKGKWHFGPVLGLAKKTIYEEESLAVKNKSSSSPLPGAFVRYDFAKAVVLADLKFAGAMDFFAEAMFDYNKKISAGPFVHMTSMDKSGSKHSFTSFGVKISYAFFLDESK